MEKDYNSNSRLVKPNSSPPLREGHSCVKPENPRKKYLSKKEIEGIREKVEQGRTKVSLAEEYGVCIRTIWYHAKDLLAKRNNDRAVKKITPEEKEKIISLINKGNSKKITAEMMNIPYYNILSITTGMNVPGKWKCRLVEKLNEQGFTFCTGGYYTTPRRALMLQNPEIKIVKNRGVLIIYVEGKKEEAARALIERVRQHKKRMSTHVLKQITNQFGITLSSEEKEYYINNENFK